VDAPWRYFGAFDLGLLPSTFAGESFPRFLLECFQASVPAVATDLGAIPQLYSRLFDDPRERSCRTTWVAKP
jgi:glycosyltransferase involved in cell wall biosynthesis